MKRYTKLITKDNDGYDYAMVKKQQYVIDCNFDASNISVTAVNRSSEEGCLYKHYYASGDAVDKLAEYENAEEQRLLVRIPDNCKVGDKVYVVCFKARIIKEKEIIGFDLDRNKISIVVDCIDEIASFEPISLLGKTIFLTEAEALQALKEGE